MFLSLSLSLPWTMSLFGKEIVSVTRGLLEGVWVPSGGVKCSCGSVVEHTACLMFLLFLPSGSNQVGRKVKRKTWIQPWESQVCSTGDLCEPLSLGVFNSGQKGRLGFPGSCGVVVNMTPGNITHWMAIRGVCNHHIPLLCFLPKLAHPSSALFWNQSCYSYVNFEMFSGPYSLQLDKFHQFKLLPIVT